MRIIEEIPLPGGKLTILAWNQKYLLKYETPELEQIYKLPETEVSNLQDLKNAALGPVLQNIKSTFAAMDSTLNEIYEKL